jgi:hypothetical protein
LHQSSSQAKNAGVSGPVGDAWQVNPDEWWRAVEINLCGIMLC